MNILIDELPCEIDGTRIKSDFRNMVLFELMMQDPAIPMDCRIPLAVDYLYAEPVRDIKKAIEGLMWFYSCGELSNQTARGSGKAVRAYDFEQDAAFIYAAFLSVYGIDLNEIDYLHWWKFRAMFRSLPDSTKLSQIMSYRMADISKMKGKERAFYQHLKQIYRIKSTMQPEQLSLAVREEQIKQHTLSRFAAAEEWRKQQIGGAQPLKK